MQHNRNLSPKNFLSRREDGSTLCS
ncbi:hypothetical protein NC653_004728 [Populus alba x Populus x berolinensis]|uniref:Uncharacterized protein n=1 Tax=Populus alba x Populus x berolinensis TaxID=444605 RepID=A0AAD6WK72_9ROSI|nr:hypothetical protein NC653_004536 [Populus alba x Populus x berolinensis]KAJ7015515.1 hypothetical protein NC653_004728 [Populus alba x Populus x berolinensis]